MLTREQRTAILQLHRKGNGTRAIKKALKISRGAIKKVIESDSSEPPPFLRPRKAEAHRQEILELHAMCKGNLVRVHEELQALGAQLSYPALTAFCRQEGIGQTPILPSGRYHFEPGQEIQHDTSQHWVILGGAPKRVHTAAAILCHSRMLFIQCYPRFRRFECKSFLTEALRFFGGAPVVVMIEYVARHIFDLMCPIRLCVSAAT